MFRIHWKCKVFGVSGVYPETYDTASEAFSRVIELDEKNQDYVHWYSYDP